MTNTVAGNTVTTEGKDQSVTSTGTCIDAAGNVADPVTVSGINIDKTPPVVTIAMSGNGEYRLGESITVTWSATDKLSGVFFPSSGTISVDAKSVGTTTFTFPAGTVKDKAGNSSIEVTIFYSVMEDKIDPVIDNIQEYEKWSGLGMMTCSTNNTSEFDSYVDTLLANGFTKIRIDLSTWNAPASVARTKAAAIIAVAKGANVIWGVDQWDGTFDGYPEFPPITAANWEDYRQAILDAAQWAQDNGIYEFQ